MTVFEVSICRLIFILCFVCVAGQQKRWLRKEAYETVPELITSAGYPVEKHRVVTSDGYILQLHRIPSGRRIARKAGSRVKGKKPVLIGHGLLGSSGDFVIMGPERSLAYLLADAGYDVWLANWRGNVYTSHQRYKRNDPKFWNYTFHEHGIYDLPATIDKVLNVTKLPQLLYIGYSMGTTTCFVMLAEKPEYNDKLIAYVALAPAVYMANLIPVIGWLVKDINIFDQARATGMLSLNVNQDILDVFLKTICFPNSAQGDICMNLIYNFIGEDMEQYDSDLTAVIFFRMQPASFGQIEHFIKIAYAGVFTAWEGGKNGIVRAYNLENVRVPVTLFYGENDKLTEKSQIFKLSEKLNSTGVLEDVLPATSWHKFNHFDFAFAKDVGNLCNKPLVKYIGYLYEKYGTKNN